MKVKIEWSWFN